MRVYIGVVESEIEYGKCRDSIEKIIKRNGDIGPVFIRATKGYEARQEHFNNWIYQTDCEYMLLLDGDMIFPPDTLEKLRSRNLPYISGAYLRRTYAPPAPVWFEDGNTFPYTPATQKVDQDKLYKIGASGWGCILIKREVVEAIEPLLKGEQLVIEDDLDVYPYDLDRVMMAINVLDNLSKKEIPANALREYVEVLKEEIRPLRASKDMVGSDIRFPFFAKMAGYDLWLDTGVICGHMLNYELSVMDFINTPDVITSEMTSQTSVQVRKETKRLGDKKKILDIAKVSETKQKRAKRKGVTPSEER